MIDAERRFCRSKIIGHYYFTGVTLNKSDTVIMGVHNGELQIVMERQITYIKSNDGTFSVITLFVFYSLKIGGKHSYTCRKNIKNNNRIRSAIAKKSIMHSPIYS